MGAWPKSLGNIFLDMLKSFCLLWCSKTTVAIRKLLHYARIMICRACHLLMGLSWIAAFLHGFIQIIFIFRLPFCGPNIIDHFMCDLNPFVSLSHTNTWGLFVAVNSGFLYLLNYLLLTGFYMVILPSLGSQSLEAREKALSIFVFHTTVVVLFFVPCIFSSCLRPATTLPTDKAVAVFYTMITPMLNPLIYTLRNTQMKNTIRKLCSRKAISDES